MANVHFVCSVTTESSETYRRQRCRASEMSVLLKHIGDGRTQQHEHINNSTLTEPVRLNPS